MHNQSSINPQKLNQSYPHKKKQTPIDYLKLKKRQIVNRIDAIDSSNTYLEYLLSMRNHPSNHHNNYQHYQNLQHYQQKTQNKQTQIDTKQLKKDIQYHSYNFIPLTNIPQIKSKISSSSKNKIYRTPKYTDDEIYNRKQISSKQTANRSNRSLKRLTPLNAQNRSLKKKKIQKSQHNLHNNNHKPLHEKQTNTLQIIIKNLNTKPQKRTIDQILILKAYLSQNNQLFRIVPQNVLYQLLKIGTYYRYGPGSVIYYTNQDRKQMYIILEGVIHFSNKVLKMKRIGFSGQIFGQQMILGKSIAIQSIKSVTKSIILGIKKQQHQRLLLQTQNKFKVEMESWQKILKMNYEKKLEERNKKMFSYPKIRSQQNDKY